MRFDLNGYHIDNYRANSNVNYLPVDSNDHEDAVLRRTVGFVVINTRIV